MIVIHDYKPTWPQEFEVIRASLLKVLGASALRIDHIGSTSVPGLGAKDVIDIQITVPALRPEIRQSLIEAGYDVTPHVMLGFHVQYGIIVDKTGDTACPSGVSCSDRDIELGIEGQYHFAPSRPLDAWLGLGLGYELERETLTVAGQSQDYSLEGPQYLKLQGGADFRVSGVMTVGPFLSFSLAEYTKATNNGQSSDIPSAALHEWLTLGVKGTFKIGG